MLQGWLVGMGRQEECTVSARKVTLPGTNVFEYTRLGIHNEPADLPDGQYEVRIAGQTVPLQKHGRAWVSPGHGISS